MNVILILLLSIVTSYSTLFGGEKPTSVNQTTFYIVRHGQTDWNKEKRKQGQANTQLNNEGRKEAAHLAVDLKNVVFDSCYSSDLDRARETAEIVIANRFVPINYDTRLRERNYGHCEGRLTVDYDMSPPQEKLDVETDSAIQLRSLAFLKQMSEEHPGKTLLIATHAGVMRNIIAQLISYKGNIEDICVNTAGFMVLQCVNGSWSIKELNNISVKKTI